MEKRSDSKASEEELRLAREIYERLQREHRWDYLNVPCAPPRGQTSAGEQTSDKAPAGS